MKLTQVKEKLPEVWKVFKFWKDRKEVIDSTKLKARDLYNFFDKARIWIEVVPLYDFQENCIDPNKWYYTINNGIDFVKQEFDNNYYSSRISAEEAAFIKAFEVMNIYILQHKIKVNEETGKFKVPGFTRREADKTKSL